MKLHRIFTAICLSAVLVSLASCSDEPREETKAKYIFLFIGDGMGMNNVAVAESYLSYKEGYLGGSYLTMTQFPYFGYATSYSSSSIVTDSSASGTAIASGEKTNNSFLGVDPDGNPVKSMAYDLKEEGYQIGIVSTVPINHATPSAFYANSANRYDYYNISRQIPGSGFDYFAGAGFLQFNGKEKDQEPIDAVLGRDGYEVYYGVEEFRQNSTGKEHAVFCQESNRKESARDYVTDGSPASDVTLAGMLELGMEFIDDEKPFFFMCEGGNIDWAAHANKVMPMINDILEFDGAIKVAYEFYLEHPEETLIVVTADHDTGGATLGAGKYYVNWNVLEEHWVESGNRNNLSEEENAELNRKASIGWTTDAHTGIPVPVFAVGKGAEKFSGMMDNTDFKGKILCE